jgi:Second Messenger Oligonucleotide or Dinucleotide Synthetase domain
VASFEPTLRELVRAIEPTAAQKEAASRSYNHLRRLIDRRAFGERIVDCYLSGSYRRKTAISPIRDIDVIFVVDPSCWPAAMFGLADKPNPSTVLKSFARVLREEYKTSSTFSQARSLRLELSHVHIDCVPAVEIPGSDVVWIGSRRDDSWTKSSPKLHHAALTAANAENDKRLLPLVKLLKSWNSGLPGPARMRSFVVETLAVTLFCQVRMRSLEDGLILFFDFIADFDGQADHDWPSTYGVAMDFLNDMVVPDSAETGANVAAGVDADRRKSFIQRAVQSRDRLKKAFAARSGNTAVEHVLAALRWGQ